METTAKTNIYNLIILDKSGSMSNIKEEALSGYNETLGTIRSAQLKHLDTQEHFVSLAAFCSCGVQMIYDKTPIKDAANLTSEDYQPCCCTPLFDAIGKTVKTLKKKIADVEDSAVLVTIITDGYENSSKEWDGKAVSKLIEECKGEGWMFSFIGAGEDVVKVATTISITNTMVWENTSEGTKKMFEDENNARVRFCTRHSAMSDPCMSLEEKKSLKKRLSEDWYKEDK